MASGQLSAHASSVAKRYENCSNDFFPWLVGLSEKFFLNACSYSEKFETKCSCYEDIDMNKKNFYKPRNSDLIKIKKISFSW